MNTITILSITLLASITLTVPNVYAEEGGFFDWLVNLFGGSEENESIPSEIVTEDETTSKISKAVIIDQLDRDFPNPLFQEKATMYLEDAGYTVDLITYEDITIDFLKNLPEMNYKFIVFRSHALAIKSDDPSVWMFTGEKYTQKKYIQEQLSGQISRAVPYRTAEVNDLGVKTASKDRHFIVGSKLVDDLMVGKFPGSVIFLGGCDTLAYPFFAQALIDRGASTVIGWNNLVGYHENDLTTLEVLRKVLSEDMGIDEAIKTTMMDLRGALDYNPHLKHLSTGASEFPI